MFEDEQAAWVVVFVNCPPPASLPHVVVLPGGVEVGVLAGCLQQYVVAAGFLM